MLGSATASAHGDHDHSKSRTTRARWGGLGYMQLGTFIGPVGDIGRSLRADGALGPNASSPEFAYTIGGGGRALVLSRLVIGGKGFGLFAPRIGSDVGTATFAGGGGGLEIGVAAVNRRNWLFIPYVGGGGMGLGVDVTNDSTDTVSIGDDEAIPPDGRRLYESGFGYLELGAGTHRLFFMGSGGFALGFDVGAMLSVGPTPWSNEGGSTVEAIDRPTLRGVYLRLSIGGGGFTFR
ncbi:MAG: hypothetical protein AAGA54_14490 [Myxococcota bacterium]